MTKPDRTPLSFEEIEKRVGDSYEVPNKVLEAIPEPMVTVRTSTYQHGPYIRECIESVLMQNTTFPVEYIIGEDFSTDGTREIVYEYAKEYPEKIRVITADYNVGMKANGRRCMGASRGTYMAICEGDDYWIDPYKLQKQVDFLEANPDYVLCAGKGMVRNNDELHDFWSSHTGTFTFKDIANRNFLVTNTVVFRNIMHRAECSTFHTYASRVLNGDIFLYLVLLMEGKGYVLADRLGVYRMHDGGIMSKKTDAERYLNSLKSRNIIIDYLKDMKADPCYVEYVEQGYLFLLKEYLNNNPLSPAFVQTVPKHLLSEATKAPRESGPEIRDAHMHPCDSVRVCSSHGPSPASPDARPCGAHRVLFVNHNIPPYEYSGTPFSTLNHALGMRRKGVEVAILVPSEDVRTEYTKEILENHTVYKVPRIDKYKAFFGDIDELILKEYLQSIRHIVRDFKPEIVHINDYVFMPEEIISLFSESGAYVVRNVCNPEELCHLDAPVYHDGKQDVLCSGPDSSEKCAGCYMVNVQKKKKDNLNPFELAQLSRKIQRRFGAIHALYRRDVDGVIFTERTFRDYFKRFIDVRDSSTKIIPRGFDFDVPRSTEHKKGHDRSIHIGFFGSLIPRKGIGLTLKAFERICHLDNFVLDIYGADATQTYLNAIQDLEIHYPGKITYHGKYENSELPRITETVDVALLPSNFETFNRLVRELMYFGVPVIVTDFFGSSVVENNVNGIKIPVGDVDALVHSLENILRDPSSIEKLSKGALETRIDSLQDEIDGIYDFYHEIIRQQGTESKAIRQSGICPESHVHHADRDMTDPAATAMEAGRLDEAEQLLRKAISIQPVSPGTYHRYGILKHQQGETVQAVSLLERALELDPTNAEAVNDLGALHHLLGEEDKAAELFCRAIELDDMQVDARKNLADIHAATGRVLEAQRLYHEILDRNPYDPEAISFLHTMPARPIDSTHALSGDPAEKRHPYSFYDESPISLQCFFVDGSSAADTIPLFIPDIGMPGTFELSFSLSREMDLSALRLDLHSSIAVVKILSLVLECRHRDPLDLTTCIVTTGTSFGEHVYFFEGGASQHIGFSPLRTEELKDAERLRAVIYYSCFGPQAVTDCIQEMARIQAYYEEKTENARSHETQVVYLEEALECAKGVIKKLSEQLEQQSASGKDPTEPALPNLHPLDTLPVQDMQPGRIAIHLHLYYLDMAEELLRHLVHMPYVFDLFITVVHREQVPLVEQKARQICGSQLAGLHVIVVPNRGRDIAAFLVTLGPHYRQYDYICHVHTKKSLFTGTEQKGWCRYLFESLFKDGDHLRRIFGIFDTNPKVGILYPTTAEHMPYWCHSWLSNSRSAQELFDRLKIGVDISSYIDYPVGSMLWARSKALQPLFDLKLTYEDFPAEPLPNDGTLCHAIERSFCISAYMKGFTFAEVDMAEGSYSIGEGKMNLWQYWGRTSDHLKHSLRKFQSISFDVFDTVVTRPLLAPDHALLLAQHIIQRDLHINIDFYALRKKAEGLVRERLEQGTDASMDAIYESFAEITGLPASTVERISEIETENEINLSIPRKDMAGLIALLQQEGKKIVFLSDMYLTSDIIERILSRNGIDTTGSQILVSSETGLRKDTGEIWQDFQQRIAQVHIGDNEHSDIQLPADKGIPQDHVMSTRRLFELAHPRNRLQHANALADSMYAGPVVARLFSSPFALHSTRGQLLINDPIDLGYCAFGPLMLYFTTWLYKRSRELGIHHLLFLAREGYLLQELFEMFSAQFGHTGIRSSYLLCSRRANSVPTIERDTDIRALLEENYTGSLANLLDSRFGIDLDTASADGSLPHERLHNETIVLPKEIDAVFKDVLKFKKVILDHAKKEKKAYLAYLKGLGISKKEKNAVVDVGFAGTIQKYLQKMTATDMQGFYFITNQKARRNPLAKKLHACFGSFVEFNQGNCIYNYSLTLESVLTAQAGQFIRFDDDRPVFGRNAHTEETWHVIRAIHSGVIEYFHDVFRWFGDALLAHKPHVDTAVHFFRLISEHPEIVGTSLRNALKVDDFYVSNRMVHAFHYADGVNKALASLPVDSDPSEVQTDLVSIVILTFNQLAYTKQCLESIERHTPEPHEIILVDNGSSDGTRDYLDEYARSHDNVVLIQNDENKGFARGNNQGLDRARGTYIVLLNNDVVVTDHWLGRLVSHMGKHPDIGMVGPMSNAVSGAQLVPGVPYGNSMKTMNQFARAYAASNSGKTTDILRLVGFCLLIRKEVLDIIGGLDETYGTGNYEDDDICLRSHIAGFRNVIAHDVFIHHFGSMTFKGNAIDYQATMQGNLQYFATKWKDIVEVSGNTYRLCMTRDHQLKKLLDWVEERFSRGDIPAATALLQRVLNIDSTNSEALNNLGVIQWQVGDTVSSLRTFQIALAHNPSYQDAAANLLEAVSASGRIDLVDSALLERMRASQGGSEVAETLSSLMASGGREHEKPSLPARTRRGKRVTVGLILATRFDKGYLNSFVPVGLGYLASSLRKELPEARVVMAESLDRLMEMGPDLVGISSQTENYAVAIDYAKTIKKDLGVPVVLGGVHVSMLPESLHEIFDVAVIGEGEITFTELVRSFIENGGFNYQKLEKIPGLAFRSNGAISRTEPRLLVRDLDALPRPVIEELPFYTVSPMECIVSSRGCPYHCAFCISEKFSQRYRCLSADIVVEEIERMAKGRGVRHIVFYDDLLVAHKKRLRKLCMGLKEKRLLGKLSFSCAVRANLVDEELCSLLNELNVTDVGMGAESFSDRILGYYNKKGVTGDINQRALDILCAHKIKVNPSFIFAAPIETKEDMLTTLRKIHINFAENKLSSPTWATLIPYPGTKIWEYALARELVGVDMDWNKFASVSDTMYLCEHVTHEEFSALIREWLVKNSLLLKDTPDRGGSFIIRGTDHLRRAVEQVHSDILHRNTRELGDDLILDKLNWSHMI